MQRMLPIDLAPRWVLVVFLLSLCEAIGLAIYFHADLSDPEVASMQPAYLEAGGVDTMMADTPACGDGNPKTGPGDCRQRVHQAKLTRKPKEQDRIIRHVESRHPQPVQAMHHG
jgi:hypothetical protein